MSPDWGAVVAARMADEVMPLVRDSVTPLAGYRAPGAEPVPIGTGTLFVVGERHFVVTAGHVIKDNEPHFPAGVCGFAVGGLDEVGTRLHPVLLNGDVYRFEDPQDVAVIALDSDSAAGLTGRRFLRLTDVVLEPQTVGFGWVVGYPNEYIREVAGVGKGFDPMTLGSVFRGDDPGTIANFDPTFNFLVDADRSQLVTMDGSEPASLPHFLNGISGCAVWQTWWPGVDRPGAWTSQRVRIVGVQTGYYRKPQFVKATKWGYVANIIYRQFPNLRTILEMHFGKVF